MPGDPALLWRLASKADADLLRRFTCAPPRPRRGLPNPEPYSREVQTWIRRDALRETNRDSRSHDQRLLLFFDAGELVAVAGHGRCPELAPPGSTARLLVAYAVEYSRRGTTLNDGRPLSDAVVAAVIDDVLTRDRAAPLLLLAKVDQRNSRSPSALVRAGLPDRGVDPADGLRYHARRLR